MSIAVSVEVKPSGMLALLFSLILVSSLSAVAYSALAYLDFMPLWLRVCVPLAWAFMIIFAARPEWRQWRKSLHIDISENGQITVEEDNGINAAHSQHLSAQALSAREKVELRSDSTLWQGLLLLRLQRKDNSLMNLVILPDCMSGESFRALRVACKWIAARAGRMER